MVKKRILLVDDDGDTRTVLKAILERMRAKVLEARDGFEALQRARQRRPDLIIMDIRMPGMDGIEACRAIRSEPDLRAIPIIVLSGAMRRARLDQIVELDRLPLYDEYLGKPFQYADLLEIVRRRLGL